MKEHSGEIRWTIGTGFLNDIINPVEKTTGGIAERHPVYRKYLVEARIDDVNWATKRMG